MIPLLRLRQVRRTFGGDTSVTALSRVDIDIFEGEMVALVGPSGAGKSTLLNVLGLLDEPSGGSYEIRGIDTQVLTPRQRDRLRSQVFGFVFQASQVLPFETVAFNAALGLSIQGVQREEREERVTQSLRQVGLLHRSRNLARTLSGGERQRLAIARAMATRPEILLADEPTGNLDSGNTESIMKLLRELNQSGVTVVIITHDHDVAQATDRTIGVHDGVSLAVVDQPPLHIVARETNPETRLDERPAPKSGSNVLERLADALSSLTSRPTRTLSLVAAFLLATGTMVAATGLGASASQQVADRLAAGALDEVYVYSPAGTSASERASEVDAILDLSHVEAVGQRIDIGSAEAQVGRFDPRNSLVVPRFSGPTVGVDSALLSLIDASTTPSTAAAALDDDSLGNVALLGQQAAAEFGVPSNVQSEIWVLGRPYTVIGFITDPGRIGSLSSSVIVPVRTLPDLPSTFVVRTTTGYPAALADAIPLKLAPGNPASVSVATVGDLRALRLGVANDLGALVWAIAIVLIVMAVLSASTAMYLSIQSRTQELALRRALGLSKGGTVTMFLLEGTLVGFAGGLGGVAIGMIGVVLIASIQGWTAVLPWQAIAVGLAAGVIGGTVSAVVPAHKAAKVEPAQAIR